MILNSMIKYIRAIFSFFHYSPDVYTCVAHVCSMNDLMLYVHGKQLRSGWDGQLFLTLLCLGKPPTGSLSVLSAYFLSSVTDNLLFLTQRKRDFLSTKEFGGREGRSRDCCP